MCSLGVLGISLEECLGIYSRSTISFLRKSHAGVHRGWFPFSFTARRVPSAFILTNIFKFFIQYQYGTCVLRPRWESPHKHRTGQLWVEVCSDKKFSFGFRKAEKRASMDIVELLGMS